MTVNLNFKSALFLLLSVIILTFSCKDENLNIQDFKDSLDALEGTTISSINEQITSINKSISDLKEVDEALEAYIKALEATATDLQKQIDDANAGVSNLRTELLAINNTLEKLKKADEALDKKITDLQTYVDTQLTAMTNWANATFATLEQYSAVQTEISAIMSLIDKTKDDIAKEYATAIETAISNSETGMKAWVNALLAQGYYTISDIDGKVSALEALISDGDTNLQNQINEQKAALQQAKADLTNEYKQYINQAIASGGIIDQEIAIQVKKANEELQSKIDAINGRLDALEDRLGKLEEYFVNRIQSLKYIPEYSDGNVLVSDILRMRITIDFIVTPASQAKVVRDAWMANNDIVKSYLRFTKSPETRAISPAIALEVTAIDVNEAGVLTVSVAEDEDNPIDADHWYKKFEGKLYLQISDGNSDVLSDFIDIQTYFDDLSKIDDTAIEDFDELSPLVEGKYCTSNSYIVSRAGAYTFKAYKGNSQELAGSLTQNNHPMGLIDNVEVLWETFGTKIKPSIGSLVQVVGYHNEFICFRTPSEFSEGNAVIAVKDANGTILWSWHIWFTDQPQGQEYYNGAGTMMDRNLGATSAIPGDIGALGLLYQWGRKDPFINSASSFPSSSQHSNATVAESTITWPSSVQVSSATGTIDYVTSHPTTFVAASSSPHNWYYSTPDDAFWKSSKTIYDPCPVGWRVPDGGDNGVWATAIGSSSLYYDTYDGTNRGINFSGKFGNDTSIWYPTTAQLNWNGSLVVQFGEVNSWSVSQSNSNAYILSCGDSGAVCPSSLLSKVHGYSVRCQKDM